MIAASSDRLARYRSRLALPLIAAPMFRVSGIDLVTAACANGVLGAFPTANCRTSEELDGWLSIIAERLKKIEGETGRKPAPLCPNLIVHRTNTRLREDLTVLVAHKPQIVVTSVGAPTEVLRELQEAGAIVLADVASIRHAELAARAGADGLVLLTSGAGGQTGWLNPFAFVRAVRSFYSGILVLAGGIGDGVAIAAAESLGCDLAYMGTKFIATHESMASDNHKRMLVDSTADDILATTAFTGLQTSVLTPSIVAAGLDPSNLPLRGPIDVSDDLDVLAREKRPKAWRDIWSAGHSVSGVAEILSVSELVMKTTLEYETARSRAPPSRS
ncbi:NAD(P)H-dependent flavin oxidoreductase [Bradyrhizobium sp. 23AC]